ncbi:DUF397 domain-containing protein [Lentzea sp. NBC_00516]|uniref:DUF397 domain-containing protein n=1 Tax=Lentzea sp. NBC_00516 TaxID=2903582 RepID=UPI002E81FDB9|nr:DUF397 domain-containing protein [Lentzea sp. NBC_00516]WUD22375.1 DUF397 domain-containing protein [Lentzea sp. NBC_00516]
MTTWRKSSYSGSSDNCVEVGKGVGIRDSKAPTTHLPLSAETWSAFLRFARFPGTAR